MLKKAGYTFIELLVVILLVLLLFSLSTPFYSRFVLQDAVDNTANQLAGSLRKAQMYSMTGKQNGSWGVHYDSFTITFFKGSSYATRNSAFDEKYSVNQNISISGFSDVVFSKVTGLPSTTPTVTISGGGSSKIISVNTQGIVNR